MRLQSWIDSTKTSYAAVAEALTARLPDRQVHENTVRRHANGTRRPRDEREYRAYFDLTGGLVTANDFFGLSGLSPTPGQMVDGLGQDAQVGGGFGRQGAGADGFGQGAEAGDDPACVVGRVEGRRLQFGDVALVRASHG